MKTHPQFRPPLRRAFTLIEMLVVVAIMAILAGLILAVGGSVTQKRTIARARAEMSKLETAIEAYKAKMGFYPPGNSQTAADGPQRPSAARTQLFYELAGTHYTNAQFVNMLGERLSAGQIRTFFGLGVDGFVNSSTVPGEAANFYRSLRPDELGNINNVTTPVRVFVLPVDGPQNFVSREVGGAEHWVAPWCYDASSPHRLNADSYDLWIDMLIGGKTNRICNWSDQPVIVSY